MSNYDPRTQERTGTVKPTEETDCNEPTGHVSAPSEYSLSLSELQSGRDGEGDAPHLSQEDVHTILSSKRRILIIEALVQDGAHTRSELGRLLANRLVGDEHDYKDYNRYHASVIQAHAPKLEEFGVVEMERDVLKPGPTLGLVCNAMDSVSFVMDLGDVLEDIDESAKGNQGGPA